MHKDNIEQILNLLDSNINSDISFAFKLLSQNEIPKELVSNLKEFHPLLCLQFGFFEIVADVEKLNLFSSQITEFPIGISKFKKLKLLFARDNQISYIPSEIGELILLEEINLYKNNLFELPSEIGKLINLKDLNLGLNHIRMLPEEIGNLINLKYLDLEGNKLKYLPESITRLTKLEELYLWDNPLSELEKQRILKLLPETKVFF